MNNDTRFPGYIKGGIKHKLQTRWVFTNLRFHESSVVIKGVVVGGRNKRNQCVMSASKLASKASSSPQMSLKNAVEATQVERKPYGQGISKVSKTPKNRLGYEKTVWAT